MISQLITSHRFLILSCLFIINILAFWPGVVLFDSAAQYAQAISGQYTDHHPPMMSFIWHYLDLVHKGPGLMFVLQLTLLYAAVAIFLLSAKQIFKNELIPSLLLLAIPIYPQILIFSVLITKDIHYAFSFLFVSSILTYYTINEKKPSLWVTGIVFSIMVYGSAVKYQGQFCVIVLAVWLGHILCLHYKWWHKIAASLVIYALVFASIYYINSSLVPVRAKNHSWQYVKLYDLAAISRALHEDLIPEANKLPAFTLEKLEQRFKYPSVDPYIYSEDNIFIINVEAHNVRILYKIWRNAVFKHPILYLKHRAINMSYALLSRPGFDYVVKLLQSLPEDRFISAFLKLGVGALFYSFMSHFAIIFVGFVYACLAVRAWKYSKAAPVLLGMSSIALSMVGILFFMSMAGVPRYTYISILLIHGAHIFAYKCWLDVKFYKSVKIEYESFTTISNAIV